MQDGATYGQHLERAARAGSKAAQEELQGPALPAVGAYVWTWFCELLEARAFTEHGPQPIGYAAMQAWAELTRRAPTSWEVGLLRDLDRTWLEKPEG